MRQAIEEEFILDVLKHYTTYAAYFKLLKARTDDPNVECKKAARAFKVHPAKACNATIISLDDAPRSTKKASSR